MQYLVALLRNPHHAFSVLELTVSLGGANEGKESTDRGIFGPQTRATYKQRLQDLQTALEEAREFNDLHRVERIQEEIETVTQELMHLLGRGKNQERTASAAERARSSMTHAIKAALRKISEHHPTLGQHLTATIKTGAFCSYTPDPRIPVSWEW